MVVASVPYSITVVSRSKKDYDFTEAQIANKFVYLDFYSCYMQKNLTRES